MKKLLLSLICMFGLSMTAVSAIIDSTLIRDTHDSIRVSLVTCSPGTEVYTVYGHTALRVEIPAQGVDMAINYGLFSFEAPHFMWRFLRGETDYVCGAINYPIFEREYTERGSSVTLQELNLSEGEKKQLIQLLNRNLSPEYRMYRYNFLYNNCSTQARDIVEDALMSCLVTVKHSHDENVSYRTIIHRYTEAYPWLQYGIDYLLGMEADRYIDLRKQDFAPEYLMRHASESKLVADSACYPFVLEVTAVDPIVPQDEVWAFPLTPVQAMVLFLLLVAVISTLELLIECRMWWFDTLLLILQGAMGVVVFFLFFFSGHPTVNSNLHVIYLNPLPLLFIPFIIRSVVRRRVTLLYYVQALMLVAFLVVSLLLDQYIQPAAYVLVLALLLRVLHNLWLFPYLKHRMAKVQKLKIKMQSSRVRAILIIIFCVYATMGHAAEVPKVVVSIVIDQFRADYLEKYAHLYGDEGFNKLFAEACVYTNGYFDYTAPDRSSAVATVYTGATPYYHGITGNRFLERKSLRVLPVVDDAKYAGINTNETASPSNLLVTTLADELKMASKGHAYVLSVAPERDMAVLAGGHAPNGVLWLSNDEGMWASSDYYSGVPAWVRPFNHRVGTIFDWNLVEWEPYYPTGVYSYSVYDGIPKAFSYKFRGGDADAVRRYKTSACVNDEVTQLALTCISGSMFGRNKTTDMLCIGYYAGNYEHASEWEKPIEQQDIYARLDRNIADLIRAVDERVGIENALFVITSTGYVDTHLPDSKLFALPTGELRMDRCHALLNMYLGALYGKDNYVEGSYLNEIYLNHGLIEKRQLKLKELQDRCTEFLCQMEGVKRVYSSLELLSGGTETDVRERFSIERSGDLILEVSPGWTLVDERWGERVHYNRAHIPVPIIFYGAGLIPQVNRIPVSVLGVAPTMAHILRISAPNACSSRPLE